jgi:hypothetical protein
MTVAAACSTFVFLMKIFDHLGEVDGGVDKRLVLPRDIVTES